MNLAHLGVILGELPETVHRPAEYFVRRGCFIDARGPLEIAPDTIWSWCVTVLTQSHEVGNGTVGEVVQRGVTVKSGAFLGSFAHLYNCVIGEGAVVAAGAVVRSCEVAPHVMVAGNPAEVIARFDGQHWQYVDGVKWRRLA